SVGIDRVVQIGCDLESARWTADVVDRYPNVLGGVAIHPNDAARLAVRGWLSDALSEIEQLAGHARIRYVGETGLDHFRTSEDGWAAQEESFRWHIDLAKRLGKALQIHDRDAHDDVLRILEEEGAPEQTVFHCFSGDEAMARVCVQRGYVLSFAGTVTFKSAEPLRAALAVTPLDRILVETDAPYLTPAPWRGRPNASYLIPHTLRLMAEVKRVSVAELALAINETSRRVVGDFAPVP
ncbi:MAG: TatD family hydrolase, partial [Actinomycetes bacterium]